VANPFSLVHLRGVCAHVIMNVLPPEVVEVIFGFVDIASLFRSCCVCRDWSARIRSLGDYVWHRALVRMVGEVSAKVVCARDVVDDIRQYGVRVRDIERVLAHWRTRGQCQRRRHLFCCMTPLPTLWTTSLRTMSVLHDMHMYTVLDSLVLTGAKRLFDLTQRREQVLIASHWVRVKGGFRERDLRSLLCEHVNDGHDVDTIVDHVSWMCSKVHPVDDIPTQIFSGDSGYAVASSLRHVVVFGIVDLGDKLTWK
jgi:hypothetical protein